MEKFYFNNIIMKNLTLIILCFFGLNIIAQTTVIIEAKDNDDAVAKKAISEVKKNQTLVITANGKSIDAKITKIITDPTQEDIRELTPQLVESVKKLNKYHDHEEKIKSLKNEKIQLETKIKNLESRDSSALEGVKTKLKTCQLQSENAEKNQKKINQEKTFTKDMINKCLQSGSKEVPIEIRDFLILSAGNLILTEEKKKLEKYNSHVAKMKSATDQLAKAYNKAEIEKK